MNAGPLVDTEDNVETHSDTVQNDVGVDMKEDRYVLEVGNALDTGAKPLYYYTVLGFEHSTKVIKYDFDIEFC